MDSNQPYNQYPTDQQMQNSYRMQAWRERIYRFFYNIWPSVYNVIAFFSYHAFRIIRGFFRIALESLKGGG